MKMYSSKPVAHSNTQQGFSLIEMAMVLMILGTLMSGVLVAISASAENARRATARTQMRQMEEALYAYAQTRGALPCPANPTPSNPLLVAGDSDCSLAPHGFFPAKEIGFAGAVNNFGLILDPWQNPYRYSVYYDNAGPNNFTDSARITALYPTYTGAALFCIASGINCTNVLTNNSPAVIFTMGANWAEYTSNEEQENGGGIVYSGFDLNQSTNNNFVSTTYSEELFDDQLIWLSPYTLFGKLVDAGRLP